MHSGCRMLACGYWGVATLTRRTKIVFNIFLKYCINVKYFETKKESLVIKLSIQNSKEVNTFKKQLLVKT